MNKVNPKNFLAVRFPDLCKEWNYKKNGELTPDNVSSSSHIPVWWICDNNHEWKASPNHRSRGSGCPCCSGHKVCIDNCLATLNSKLASEWHTTKNGKLTSRDVTCGSNEIVWWKCSICGNEWMARIDSRKISDCPKCTRMIKSWRKNKNISLFHKYPELAKEWHPTKNGNLKSNMLTPKSHRKVWWICEKGHEWEASPHDRVHKKCGCPYCAGKRACEDNCLATVSPELSKEWHPTKNGNLTPYDVVNGSGKKVWWLCPRCGRQWKAIIVNRSKGHGCECYRNAVLKDGTVCDSMLEVLFYLRFKKDRVVFIYHGLYGKEMGKHTYDFYIPESNTYIEVTSFHKRSYKYKQYFKTIKKKKKYVEQKLGANFLFISYIPTKEEYKYIKDNLKLL